MERGGNDEWLLKNATQHKNTANEMQQGAVEQFSAVANPGTGVFIEKLDEMNRIYNHTSQIYFDDKKIYLVTS